MKFSTGDKVVEKEDVQAHSSYPVQQVVGILDGALLLTPWGDSYDGELHHYDFLDEYGPGSRTWRESIQRHTEEELFTPEEALAEVRRLEADQSKLSQEFDLVRDKIKSNLEQAAKLTDEAATLLTGHDRTFESIIQECAPLYHALKKGGWRHSTAQCRLG